MSETLPNPSYSERVQPNEQQLLALGLACIEATQRTDLATVEAEHAAFNPTPNRTNFGLFVGGGDVPMSADNVYRQVGIEAIEDLAQSGIVRNGATGRGGELPRYSHSVYWNSGKEDTNMHTAGRFVIEAPKAVADQGWVRADHVKGIYTKTPEGQTINILDQPK